jgi:rare lipoprotein A
VIGALFRRERENPGPLYQISSDAAAALDILAGAPTTLQVIALRREEAPGPEMPTADMPSPWRA